MGIRPSMQLRVGLTDLNIEKYDIADHRWTLADDWREMRLTIPPEPDMDDLSEDGFQQFNTWIAAKHFLGDEGKEAWEAVEWRSSDGGIGSCIGINVAEIDYANDCLYVLALMDKRFMRSGFWEIPSLSLEEDESHDGAMLKYLLEMQPDKYENIQNLPKEQYGTAARKKRVIEDGHNYPFFSMSFSMWLDTAFYILHDCLGMKIERKDLKLYLYWEWS